MNPDPQPEFRVTTYTYHAADLPAPQVVTVTYCYDSHRRLTVLGDPVGPAQPPSQPEESPTRPTTAPFAFEHDREKGIFRITGPSGEVEVFRDKPVRHLVVEPDPVTGELKPVLRRGSPTYLYLCREEREIR